MIRAVTLTAQGCDRSTAYHQANKIVRAGDALWVTWLSEDYRCIVAEVAPDGRVRGEVPVSQGFDNHCGGALTRTPDGVLHFMSGSHHLGFIYRSSAAPMRPESWSLPQGVGATATYPSFVHDLQGALHLAHRRAAADSATPWGVNWTWKVPGEPWRKSIGLLRMPSPLYTYPTNALVAAPDGTLHLLVEWYKTWPNNICEARSVAVSHLERTPAGEWRHTDGRPVRQYPVVIEDCNLLLARAQGNPRPGNVALLPDGRPCFAAWDQFTGETVLAVRRPDRTWQIADLTAGAAACDPGHLFNSHPQIAVNGRGEILLVASRAPAREWAHPGSRIVRLASDDTGRILRYDSIAPGAPGIPDWLPNIEKPAPGVYPDRFHLLFQRGNRGEGCINTARCEVMLATVE